MDAVTLLGLTAATCTTVAFLPQVIKNWRTKSAGDLSFGTFGLFTCGVVLWLIYGGLIDNVPIIVSNLVTLALNVANLAQMIWYREPRADAGGPLSTSPEGMSARDPGGPSVRPS